MPGSEENQRTDKQDQFNQQGCDYSRCKWVNVHFGQLLSLLPHLRNTVLWQSIQTGGCVTPETTCSHTVPKNSADNLCNGDNFQHEMHRSPSVYTHRLPHSSSVMLSGFKRFLLACSNFTAFMETTPFCFLLRSPAGYPANRMVRTSKRGTRQN